MYFSDKTGINRAFLEGYLHIFSSKLFKYYYFNLLHVQISFFLCTNFLKGTQIQSTSENRTILVFEWLICVLLPNGPILEWLKQDDRKIDLLNKTVLA